MSNLFGEDYDGRKAIPIFEGVLMYFPKALAAVAEVSYAGNAQHNPGEPLHWARGKSMDQYNTAIRHLMDHRMGGGRADPQSEGQDINNGWIKESRDKDGVRHLAKAAWRVLAALQLAIEEEEAGPQQGAEFEEFTDLSHVDPVMGDYYTIDRVRTDAAFKVGGSKSLVYCWKPMCEGHAINTGTCRV